MKEYYLFFLIAVYSKHLHLRTHDFMVQADLVLSYRVPDLSENGLKMFLIIMNSYTCFRNTAHNMLLKVWLNLYLTFTVYILQPVAAQHDPLLVA